MSALPEKQTTSIATSTTDDVFIRDVSLCRELIGKVTFTELIYFQLLGRRPTPPQVAVLDACLVTLMEHGLTPSALATRLVYSSAEEAMQAAVAAGLLAVGSRFVGTTEGCGELIERIVRAGDGAEAEARRIASAYRAEKKSIPGFGHPFHKPDDPRSPVLIALAREQGVAGAHVAAVLALSAAIDETFGKHITLNATGAIAAVLGDAGIPRAVLRGISLIARAAGLVGHVHEEQQKPAMRAIWEAAEAAVPYDGSALERA
ncbi:MAG TPA: citryl-CoA lyase [Polyangiaceae bacterium]|nr:citryl-CoA lyase [Polyangiaceae bacterium]